MIRKFNPCFLKSPLEPRYDLALNLAKSYQILHLEIGAGVGLHPIQYTFAHQHLGLIAVERTREKYDSFVQRIASNQKKYPHQLNNLIAINADIVPWLWYFDQQIQFDKIWILYPNPEPGNKNQRWINSPFFSHLLERLKPEGEIEIATNISDYANEIQENALKNWNLRVDQFIYSGPGRTHFEKKYLDRGETCYQLILKQRKK